MKSRAKSITIIGGGIAGMSTALILSRHGCNVSIVEKKTHLGPLLRGFTRQGIHFDTGLHYVGGLHSEGALSRYFHLLGLDDLPLVEFTKECFDRICFTREDLEISLPIGLVPMVEKMYEYFPLDRDFISNYFSLLNEAFLSSSFLNFDGDFNSKINSDFQQKTLASVLDRGTDNPVLKTVLSIHSLLYGVSPEETSFLQHARIAGSYLDGVKTIAGGGETLVTHLQQQLDNNGVISYCSSAVSHINFSSHGLVKNVILEDERCLPSDGVVFTAHPSLLPSMLPPGIVRPAFTRRLSALEDTVSSYTLFGASKSPIPAIQGNNLFICQNTDIRPSFLPDCTPENGPFYITSFDTSCNSNIATALMAFAPGNVVECRPFANSSTGSRSTAYNEFKAQRLSSIRETLVSHCPEILNVNFVDGATPLTNRDFLDSPGCGLYGAKHTVHQFNPLPVTRIPNLWMAGQSVVAPGILGTIISAFIACAFIVGVETIKKEITGCQKEG